MQTLHSLSRQALALLLPLALTVACQSEKASPAQGDSSTVDRAVPTADGAPPVTDGGTTDSRADSGSSTDAATTDLVAPDTSSVDASSSAIANSCLRFSGQLADDALFSLEAVGGATFGSGATIYLYTDFRDQTVGTPWNGGMEKVHPQLVFGSSSAGQIADGRGQSKAIALGSLGGNGLIRVTSMPPTTNVFVSRALKIAAGRTWTGSSGWPNGSPEVGVFPSDSTFKMSWLMSKAGSYGTADNNLCLPTHHSGHNLGIGGNSHNFSGASAALEAVSFTDWTLVEGWVRADPADVTSANGDGYLGVYSSAVNSVRAELKGRVFTPNLPGRTWVAINLPGWLDINGSDGILETDLYVADGAQRLLLADHYHLGLASKVVMLPHESWSDRAITAKLRLAGLFDPQSDPLYLHVIDADNQALCAPLALANAIAVPQGTPSEVGSADSTGRAWVDAGAHFFLLPEAYQARTGDVGISKLTFTAEPGLHDIVSFAIYESSTSDWRTAQRVAEVKMRPPAVANATAGSYAAQRFDIPLNVELVPGRYYWRGVTLAIRYDYKGTGGGNVLKSTSAVSQVECPQAASATSMTDTGYPLALSMTVVRP